MPVRIDINNTIVTSYISGEIDHHSAKHIREEIDECIGRVTPKLLVLNFKDVSFMDSSGIGLVMGRYKLMQSIDGKLSVTNTSPHIKRVMKLAGLERLYVLEKGGK